MKKKLVICCDGTWATADQVTTKGEPCVTNVVKIAVRTAKEDGDVPQVIYYDQGVGTGDVLDKVVGGVAGEGLFENINDAYRFLIANYQPGDELYVFGFSRGAYTARSMVGMVRKCGILRREHAGRYHEAAELYRNADVSPNDDPAKKFRAEHSFSDRTEVKFLGMWDTVGSLGVPVWGFGSLAKNKYKFHDTELSGDVRFAYHALAIDERRGPFKPTLWSHVPKDDQYVEQVWFAGVHTDIGGGYENPGLSDITLSWMLGKAEERGLVLDKAAMAVRNIPGDPLMQPPNDSMKLPFSALPKYQRPICLKVDDKGEVTKDPDPTQHLHPTVLERWDKLPSYRPPQLREYLKRIGDARGSAP
ncbi:MAG: hypothetical protein QOI24_4478 [Acidobacteriota bacterium]|jgi:uncharacterized protein (DUF2235 family)|nr:hypothetical protein [Acidobacteriota bacterium]